MKILFVQNVWIEFLGTMSISSILKENGHECDLIIENNPKKIAKYVNESHPDIVGFYCMTGMHNWVIKVAKEIKKSSDIPIILGGPHSTFSPEIINEQSIDIICRGEGEYAVLELLNGMSRGEDITKIKNLWVKKNGKIYENEMRPLIADLDELPFPDRDLYYKYSFLRKSTVKFFMTGRGCPFNCTFCFNHHLRKLYQNKGNYIRKRSVDNVIKEIKIVKEKFGISTVCFLDDTFNINFPWLKEFFDKYKKEVNIPYYCQIRGDIISENLVKDLKSSGCFAVELGLESGNELLRKSVLKKNITNEQFITGIKLLKKYGLIVRTNNMLCIPDETLENVFETIDLNREMEVDVPWCSIFMSYPRLELTEYAISKNLLDRNFDFNKMEFSLHRSSSLNIENKNQLENLHKFFYLAVKFPSLIPLIKILIKLPPNKLFYLIYGLSNIYINKVCFKYTPRYVLELAIRSLPSKII